MQRLLSPVAVLSLALLLAPPAAAGAPPQGDAAAGAVASRTELCQECHGEDGNSGDTQYPKLAGQRAAYIAKQLRDFQSGARRQEVMSAMAESLTESQRQDIAAYFESREQVKARAAVEQPAARALFERGDAARGIAPCASCHGTQGRGLDLGAFVAPRIAGQRYYYLRATLGDWRNGDRHNSPGNIMNLAARRLGDDEIAALADYLAGL